MSALVLPCPKQIKGTGQERVVSVELRLSADYHEGDLSQGEIKALSPYLPELAAELLAILFAADDRE